MNNDITVKKSIMRWRFVHFNKHTRVMKTGYFVSKRKSIWSIADGASQSFAADVMDKEARGEKTLVKDWVYKIQIPLPMIMISILNTIAISFMVLGVLKYAENNGNLFARATMIVGITGFMFILLVYEKVLKIYLIMQIEYLETN